MNQTFFLIFNHRTKSHAIYPIYRKKKDKSKLKQFSTDLRKKKKFLLLLHHQPTIFKTKNSLPTNKNILPYQLSITET